MSGQSTNQDQLEDAYGGWNPRSGHGLAGWGMEVHSMLNAAANAGPNSTQSAVALAAQKHRHDVGTTRIGEGVLERENGLNQQGAVANAVNAYKAKDQYDAGNDTNPPLFGGPPNQNRINQWAQQRRGFNDARQGLQQQLYGAAQNSIGRIFGTMGNGGSHVSSPQPPLFTPQSTSGGYGMSGLGNMYPNNSGGGADVGQ